MVLGGWRCGGWWDLGKLIWKKNTIEPKESGAGTFMFAKKVHKNIYKYPSYLLSKCFSNLLLILTFFSDTNHGRGKIGGTFTSNVSLVPPV